MLMVNCLLLHIIIIVHRRSRWKRERSSYHFFFWLTGLGVVGGWWCKRINHRHVWMLPSSILTWRRYYFMKACFEREWISLLTTYLLTHLTSFSLTLLPKTAKHLDPRASHSHPSPTGALKRATFQTFNKGSRSIVDHKYRGALYSK